LPRRFSARESPNLRSPKKRRKKRKSRKVMREKRPKLILLKKPSPIPTLTRKMMTFKLMLRTSCDWRETAICTPAAAARRKAELRSLRAGMLMKVARYSNWIGRKAAVA